MQNASMAAPLESSSHSAKPRAGSPMTGLSGLPRGARVLALVAGLIAAPAGAARAQQYLYIWTGPSFATASGTISVADSVSGSLVLEGPVENLPFGEVAPVSFSFSAGPVTIDDSTPLHALTRIRLQTDADGEVLATEIQLVREVDTGSGVIYTDVICIAQCPASGPNDAVIDRNDQGGVLGEGEVAIASSYWSSPVPFAPSAPALPLAGQLALAAALAAVARRALRFGSAAA